MATPTAVYDGLLISPPASSATLTLPPSTAAGDLLLVWVGVSAGAVSFSLGWTEVRSDTASGGAVSYVYQITVTSAMVSAGNAGTVTAAAGYLSAVLADVRGAGGGIASSAGATAGGGSTGGNVSAVNVVQAPTVSVPANALVLTGFAYPVSWQVNGGQVSPFLPSSTTVAATNGQFAASSDNYISEWTALYAATPSPGSFSAGLGGLFAPYVSGEYWSFAWNGGIAQTVVLVSATVPAAPTIGTATAKFKSAVVRWTAPANNGGSPITGYVITPSSGSPVTVGNVTNFTVTGLQPGTSYTFEVAAINAIGTGAQSGSSNAVIPTAGGFLAFMN